MNVSQFTFKDFTLAASPGDSFRRSHRVRLDFRRNNSMSDILQQSVKTLQPRFLPVLSCHQNSSDMSDERLRMPRGI